MDRTPVDPAEALLRIAYLLDHTHAPTFKVAAFRKAADAVRLAGPERLVALHSAGRLRDLPGLGDTTAQVVREALDGQVPAYLAKLEADAPPNLGMPELDGTGGPAGTPILDGDALVLRNAIQGDCHLHSSWSDGGASIVAMAEAAAALGHSFLVITDHSPRLRVANGLSIERLARQRDEIDRLNEELAPFRLLRGVEVDINNDGSLDGDPDVLDALDVVVASVHSRLGDDVDTMTARMVSAVTHPLVDILGHCTNRLIDGPRKRKESTFDVDTVFGAIIEHDKALEINCRPERLDPPMAMLERAVELGCRFAIDSDAHSTEQLGWLPYGCDRAARAGVTADRVVNASPAQQLLAWTGQHH